ncbi:MAG: hypothetical protein ACREPY_09965 [Rhodanobacteraceae bacterium]
MQAGPMRIRTFSFHPPRHPLLRALMLLCGVVVLVGLATVGFLIGAAVLAVAAVTMLVRRWLHAARHKVGESDVLEGEFTVVSRPRAALPRTE